MSKWACVIVAAVLSMGPSLAGAASGVLDPTFGDGGIVLIDTDAAGDAADLSVTPDGRIVTLSTSGDTLSTRRMRLTRHLSDGSLDPSFGVGGVVVTDSGESLTANGLLVRPDGSVQVSAHRYFPVDDLDLVLLRYLPDGTLDPTFGVGGVAFNAITPRWEIGRGAPVELADGRIVVAGGSMSPDPGSWSLLIARFDAQGLLDPTFATGGVFIQPLPGRHDLFTAGVQALADGRLLAAGYSETATLDSRLLVARFLEDGTLDPSFAAGGLRIDERSFFATGVVPSPDGSVVVSGHARDDEGDAQFFLARYDADGASDPSFGDAGLARGPEGEGIRMAPTPDGRFVVAGERPAAPASFEEHVSVVRYTPSGDRDWTFGDHGVATLPPPSSGRWYVRALAVQADGRPLMGGIQYSEGIATSFIARFTATICGDGVVDDGEVCDDGNVAGGDGCSPSCTMERCHRCAGSPSVCAPGARPTCRASTRPAKSPLTMKRGNTPAASQLVWTWREGEATAIADFGDPTDLDGYGLCLFDASGAPVVSADVPAGERCRNKPCWKATASRITYVDPERTPDGIDRVLLRAGVTGVASVQVRGKGADLALPTLPIALPATMQLHREDGQCWGAEYDASTISRNGPTVFKGAASQ